jgi:hypothetical protein
MAESNVVALPKQSATNDRKRRVPADDVMIADCAAGMRPRQMAEKYGVTDGTVYPHLRRLGLVQGRKFRPAEQVPASAPTEPASQWQEQDVMVCPAAEASTPNLDRLVLVAELMRRASVDARTAVEIVKATRPPEASPSLLRLVPGGSGTPHTQTGATGHGRGRNTSQDADSDQAVDRTRHV